MVVILHIELVEQTRESYLLRFWRDNPNEVQTRPLSLLDIADLVNKAETDYYSPLPARLQDIGQRLFRWLDGGERWLTVEIGHAANHAQVLVLAIVTSQKLAHLPWEVVHNGTMFLLHALNPPVLPVRWRKAQNTSLTTQNRPLQVLFMASSPENVGQVLDYEQEESAILEAAMRPALDLTVEESGCLSELGALMSEYGAGYFDVLHLTGHAEHNSAGHPVFLLEDPEGKRTEATAVDIANKLPHRPPLVFLSGCRTGQNPVHGEVRSLAEQLIEVGFCSVLGWGRPVRDTEATLAAKYLYTELSAGESLPLALVRTHRKLREDQTQDWHLLRLFCAGHPSTALVTPLRTPNRKSPVLRLAESEFLDLRTKEVKVATRASFVGRRRLLQRSLRRLREPQMGQLGLLLHGQGGRGKSSVAARLCDRLRRDFQRIVIIGRLDEPSLLNAWAPELPDDAHRKILREPGDELRFRIERTLRALVRQTKDPELLKKAFVAADGNPRLFEWLHQVLEHPGLDHARILAEVQRAEERFRQDILARELIASLPQETSRLLSLMLQLRLPVPLEAVQALAAEWSVPELRQALAHAADISLVDISEADHRTHYRVPQQLGGAEPPLLAVPIDFELTALGPVFDALYKCWWTEAHVISEIHTLELIRLANASRRNEQLILLARNVAAQWVTSHRYGETLELLEPLMQELQEKSKSEETFASLETAASEPHSALKEFQSKYAYLQDHIGGCHYELGIREGVSSSNHLKKSVHAYREALKVRTREQLPQDWAMTQNNLGNALRAQAARSEGAEAVRLLNEAVGAYREALKVYTREQLPQDWAMTQNNLGNALRAQAARSEGAEAVRLLNEAVGAYREALKVYTREQLPQDWAGTQNNLGNALSAQAARSEGAEAVRLLNEAVGAYREALKVYTREQLPQDWAMTQNNLGNALRAQAARSEGAEAVRLLNEAVGAYREALKVYTREQLPQDWAGTQNNLGNALSAQAARSEGAEAVRLLNEAVGAYREALKVYTREQLPQDWAMTQNNLGAALRAQAARSEGAEAVRLLNEAVGAYREALKVYTREQLPQDWAMTQNNLGVALRAQAARSEGAEAVRLLSEAVGAYREALKVYTREQLPQDWAMTQNNLGAALSDQAARSEGAEAVRLLHEAVGAYREALKVYTREHAAYYHGLVTRNLQLAMTQLQKASR